MQMLGPPKHMMGADNGLMKQNRKTLKTIPSLGLSICEKELEWCRCWVQLDRCSVDRRPQSQHNGNALRKPRPSHGQKTEIRENWSSENGQTPMAHPQHNTGNKTHSRFFPVVRGGPLKYGHIWPELAQAPRQGWESLSWKFSVAENEWGRRGRC